MRISLNEAEKAEAEEILARSNPAPPYWDGLPREKVINLLMFKVDVNEHEANAIYDHSIEPLQGNN